LNQVSIRITTQTALVDYLITYHKQSRYLPTSSTVRPTSHTIDGQFGLVPVRS